MDKVFVFVQAHSTAILAVSGYLFSAGVVSLPPEGEPFRFYPWFARTLRQLLNMPHPAFKQTEQGKQVSDSYGVTKTEIAKTTEQTGAAQ